MDAMETTGRSRLKAGGNLKDIDIDRWRFITAFILTTTS
jgi:hypothetical protein